MRQHSQSRGALAGLSSQARARTASSQNSLSQNSQVRSTAMTLRQVMLSSILGLGLSLGGLSGVNTLAVATDVLSDSGEIVYQGWDTLGQWELDDLKKAEAVFAKAQADMLAINGKKGNGRRTNKKIVRQFQQSVALFDQFVFWHTSSRWRCRMPCCDRAAFQLSGQRQKALAIYQEVLDFSDEVVGAAPARYYRGETYLENGDTRKSMAEFAQMVQDQGYKTFIAANALNALGEELIKRGEARKALKYLQQLAVDFRRTNPDQARIAIDRVRELAVQTKQAPLLQEFYLAAGGLGKDRVSEKDLPKTLLDAAQQRGFWSKCTATSRMRCDQASLQSRSKSVSISWAQYCRSNRQQCARVGCEL